MAIDLEYKEIYGAGGIDQSESPRANTAQDACNIETSRGTWRLAPGHRYIRGMMLMGMRSVLGASEYWPDRRYKLSDYYSLILGAWDPTEDGSIVFYEVHNSEMDPVAIQWLQIGESGPASLKGTKYDKLQFCDGLYRWVGNPEPEEWYVPAKIIFNGNVENNAPLIYWQYHGVGHISYMGADDGGDSSLTYLAKPPKAKFWVMYKERIFALNCEEGANVGFHTGLYQNAAYVMNVWPAEYNFSIGGGDEITGARVLNDVLYIFKRNEIWALSGDGIDCNWQLEKVDSEHGAFHQDAIVDVGNALIFLGGSGEAIYSFDGNRVGNLSHPRLRALWEEYDWTEAQPADTYKYKHFQGVYDPNEKRVIFKAFKREGTGSGAIAYNLENDSWDRWGAWPGNPPGGLADQVYATEYFNYLFQSKHWFHNKIAIFGFKEAVDPFSDIGMYQLAPNEYLYRESSGGAPSTKPIHFFIMGNRMYRGDNEQKLVRRWMVRTRRTGDWDLGVMVIKGNLSITQGFSTKRGLRYEIITDGKDANGHEVAGTNENFIKSADGPVDIYYTPTLYKVYSSIGVAVPGANDITFLSSIDSTNRNGLLVVVPEDSDPLTFIRMKESNDAILGSDDWGDALFIDQDVYNMVRGDRSYKGQDFKIFITNIGSYNDSDGWAKKGMPFECEGWGIWIRRRGVRDHGRRITADLP